MGLRYPNKEYYVEGRDNFICLAGDNIGNYLEVEYQYSLKLEPHKKEADFNFCKSDIYKEWRKNQENQEN